MARIAMSSKKSMEVFACRARRPGGSWRPFALAALVLVAVPAVAPAATAASEPAAGDFIVYAFHRHVGSGWGEYEDYVDNTNAQPRLDILSNNGTEVAVRSVYHWTYADNEGHRLSGDVNRVVTFRLATRTWTSALTDDDDHDRENASDFYEWFWIPPTVAVGDRVGIVDDEFVVTSLQATVWTGNFPKFAIELKASGGFSRNDDYGTYSVAYTDAYYYDRATGYIVAERYTEYDRGTYQGRSAGFTWTETVDVVSSSYTIPVDWVTYYIFLGQVGLVIALLGVGVYAYRWRAIIGPVPGVGSVKVKRIWRAKALPAIPAFAVAAGDSSSTGGRTTLWAQLVESSMASAGASFGSRRMPNVTQNFGPHLPDFVRKALLAGDLVALAKYRSQVVGVGIFSRDAKVGQIFTDDAGVAESLRSYLKAQDFFAEFRHAYSEGARSQVSSLEWDLPTGDAYNILDEYLVLGLDKIGGSAYDASLVSRMQPSDLPAIASIATRVYGAKSDRWLKAQLATGDIGFVARADGKVVGFAFASLVGRAGRLHTITVLPEYRNRGIGRELLRARLQALEALGAEHVITEIATWNLPSLQLAFNHGFTPVGRMWIETTRSRPTGHRPMRR